MPGEIITCWKSRKWDSLNYYSNHEIVLALFCSDDFYKDSVGELQHRVPFIDWKNSWIGEDISREFKRHEHRKKAIWSTRFSSKKEELHLIKFIFSWLTKTPMRKLGKEDAVIFEICPICHNLVEFNQIREDRMKHLTPYGTFLRGHGCQKEYISEEEEEGQFFEARIQGL